jgi:hypothetical protein
VDFSSNEGGFRKEGALSTVGIFNPLNLLVIDFLDPFQIQTSYFIQACVVGYQGMYNMDMMHGYLGKRRLISRTQRRYVANDDALKDCKKNL